MKFTLPELAGTVQLQGEIASLTAALDAATRAAPPEYTGFRAKYGTRRAEARRFVAEACAQDEAPKPIRKIGRALQPNVGIQLAYRDKLLRAIDDMHRSVAYWVVASYERAPPATMAHDAFDPSEARAPSGEWTSGGQTLYHVTPTSRVASIKKQGLTPKGHRAQWARAGGGSYGGGGVYAFTNEADARRWASRMDYNLGEGKSRKGGISIVQFTSPAGDRWKVDDRDPLSQLGKKGPWLHRQDAVGPERILRADPMTPEMVRALVQSLNDANAKWVADHEKDRLALGSLKKAVAQDELSFRVMEGTMRELTRRWLRKFEDTALYLAGYFATRVSDRTDDELKRILAEGGITIEPKATAAQRDALGAIVRENVSLIRSIPQRYLGGVEQAVMRSIQSGGDLKTLADTLQEQYGSTRERAALIARDQNTKATAMLQRVRFVESGINECIWMHSSAGKTPRPTHLKAGQDKQRFDPAEGWYDPHEDAWILPGQLIGCRCTCRPVFDKLPVGRVKASISPLGVKWGA